MRFPFQDPQKLYQMLENNLESTNDFIAKLGSPSWQEKGPVWTQISTDKVLDFLGTYEVYSESRDFVKPLLTSYIEKQNLSGELINWTVAVFGRATEDLIFGEN